LDPSDISTSKGAWRNKGTALGELGRFDEAFASFDRALALDEFFRDAREKKALYLLKVGREAEAKAEWKRAQADPAIPF
jgi:tetratricopeptide (TPR) repeat protein